MGAAILVVEDDPNTLELVALGLEDAGYRALRAASAEEAEASIAAELPDGVVLDLVLPGQSGLALLRRMRFEQRTQHLPVLVLTGHALEEDRVLGLEAGADDYIVKPFSARELAARVGAVLRRRRQRGRSHETVEIGGVQADPLTQRASVDGQRLELPRTQFRLLYFLMTHPGRLYSRSQLRELVWADEVSLEERSVDVHITRLRKALAASGNERMIETVRGSGYRLRGA
ncbi:MAG: two-component system, OmpR family, phosphate regulon response regulator PhoB [Betaproteobacteria bacterium]|jgi:two-component system phosphate regulon response regulator PhoB|nr:two-component system, OmpR family, phosphate regulon response regulator PhoB [Betaproteobacteria bacterium]